MLLVLRAGGEQIGWGFQLQSPLFVTLMIYLLLAVGLNLSGVFEVGGGSRGSRRWPDPRRQLSRVVLHRRTDHAGGDALHRAVHGRRRRRRTDAIAARCAWSFSPRLGVGLALPYLLLSLAPWMRRALPKPGAWMDTLKQIFAFPMYASAAWLLWVLAQQTSSIGLGAALAGAILVALRGLGLSEIQVEFDRRSRDCAGHRRGRGAPRHRAADAICGRRGRLAPTSPRRRAHRPRSRGSPTIRLGVAELERERRSRCWSISPRAGA